MPKQDRGRRRRRKEHWESYVRKLAEQKQHLGVGFSGEGMRCVEALVEHLIKHITREAIDMKRARNRHTLTKQDVTFGAMLVYPHALVMEAKMYANDAVETYFWSRERAALRRTRGGGGGGGEEEEEKEEEEQQEE